MGQLALSKELAGIGIRCHVQRDAIPSKGFLSIQEVYAYPECFGMSVSSI